MKKQRTANKPRQLVAWFDGTRTVAAPRDAWLAAWLNKQSRRTRVLRLAEEIRAVINLLEEADRERRLPFVWTEEDEIAVHCRRLSGMLRDHSFTSPTAGVQRVGKRYRLRFSPLPTNSQLRVLLEVAAEDRFPRKCLTCGTWFVPVPKKRSYQRFCNDLKKRCRQQYYESDPAHRRQRRDYMRKWMRDKREKERREEERFLASLGRKHATRR